MSFKRQDKEPIGELVLNLPEHPIKDGTPYYNIQCSVKDKHINLEIPRYHTHLGWVEIFGLPPFNEWVILEDINKLNGEFEGELGEGKFSESIQLYQSSTVSEIELQREYQGKKETAKTLKTNQTFDELNSSISITNWRHTSGTCSSHLKALFAETDRERDQIKNRASPEHRKYMEEILEEEEDLPDSVVLKKAVINGETPAVYRNLFPFWNTTNFSNMEVEIIELIYREYGDNQKDIDSFHGRIYKLFSFEDFDHDHLEIREGNWKSTEIEFQGQKTTTKEHYEKHLYEY